jgi:two-component system, OmpR family, KDP operon response regulator KdpE
VLVCDDEPQIVRAVRVILHEGGYDVSGAGTLAEALDLAARRSLDAAIVDLILPDGDGIELCTELRSWSTMPIIVLSALEEEEQKVLALQAGADDYLTKPFAARELLARLDALFRRVSQAGEEEAVIHANGVEINLPAHTVRRKGEQVRLTPTEFKLLTALARNRGRLMTSRALLTEVWGAASADDTPLLRTHIANLRHKLEGAGAGSAQRQLITTEPGVGYRFGS